MAQYPIKMLNDEEGVPFVPLVSTDCIRDPGGKSLEQRLATKLGPDNLLGGSNISVRTEGNNCYIDLDLPSSLSVIDNLTTTTSGQGALDAHQGNILKNMIPVIVDDVISTDATKVLSARQGYVLNNKFNDYVRNNTLATVATSGKYSDLTGCPSIINTLTSTSQTDALSAAQGKALNDKITNLATVATSGSYNDLSNKPTVLTMSQVVSSGSNSNGSWIKYGDGTMICYKKVSFTDVVINTVWGNGYETASKLDFGSFPQSFTDVPMVNITLASGSTCFTETFGNRSKSAIGETWLWKPIAEPGGSMAFDVMAIGKWK